MLNGKGPGPQGPLCSWAPSGLRALSSQHPPPPRAQAGWGLFAKNGRPGRRAGLDGVWVKARPCRLPCKRIRKPDLQRNENNAPGAYFCSESAPSLVVPRIPP